MKKPINLSIYITLKTYNDIKNKVKKNNRNSKTKHRLFTFF